MLKISILQNVRHNCTKPCKHPRYLSMCMSFSMSREINSLPLCENLEDQKCFNEVFELTLDTTNVRPCTKVQYKVKNKNQMYSKEKQNLVTFKMSFDPHSVKVHEEYLIYDLVAMISAIGGTMGLCIGFSFTNILSSILRYLAQINNRKDTNPKCEISFSRRNRPSERKVHQNTLETSINRIEEQIHQCKRRILALEAK